MEYVPAFCSLNGSGDILHAISRGMNMPLRGMNIHLYFPASELILCCIQDSISRAALFLTYFKRIKFSSEKFTHMSKLMST